MKLLVTLDNRLKQRFITSAIVFLFGVLLFTACSFASLQGISTYTPSPTFTPTCPSGIQLSTPEGWTVNNKFVVILVDQDSPGEGVLQYRDKTFTQDAINFIDLMLPKIVGPRDLISVFQLGPRDYEDARISRLSSTLSKPQLYDPPENHATLTPIATLGTQESGLEGIATANYIRAMSTSLAATEVALARLDDCAREDWQTSAMLTAESWQVTEIAERERLGQIAQQTSEVFVQNSDSSSVFIYETAYFGLEHATIDLDTYCDQFDECLLIIIDDLTNGWTGEYYDHSNIDLSKANEILVIMPNCRDITQPSCKYNQTFWSAEFSSFGAITEPNFVNGDDIENYLENYLRR